MREVIAAPVSGSRSASQIWPPPDLSDPRRRFCLLLGNGGDQSPIGGREHSTVTSETRRIFENLKLLLESAGSSLDRLVQVHAMIYDRIEYDVRNRAYRQFLPSALPAPTVMRCRSRPGSRSCST